MNYDRPKEASVPVLAEIIYYCTGDRRRQEADGHGGEDAGGFIEDNVVPTTAQETQNQIRVDRRYLHNIFDHDES